jgi:hypothetical protein
MHSKENYRVKHKSGDNYFTGRHPLKNTRENPLTLLFKRQPELKSSRKCITPKNFLMRQCSPIGILIFAFLSPLLDL